MTTTTLEPAFLQAVLTMTAFKPQPMRRVQAALIYLGLRLDEFTAADLPESVTGGSAHIAGAATGALVAQGLLVVVGRVKSPRASSKGRRVDVLRLASRSNAHLWLARNGFSPLEQQEAFAFA